MVHIYSRVSTDDQAQHGTSLASQRDGCLAYCRAQAFSDAAWGETSLYVDDGESGKSTDRPGLRRLLAAIRPGDMLLVYKLDRLTRSLGDLDQLLKRALAEGWHLRSVTESLDTSSATGRAMVHMIGLFAQWERETIVERTRAGKVKRASQGRIPGSPAAFGLQLDNGIPREDAAAAAQVRDIYRWYLDEYLGVHQIVKRLNAAGTPSPGGGHWTTATVHRILRNPVYVGDLEWGEVQLRGVFDPIIDRDIWERVQARLSRTEGGWKKGANGEANGTPRIPARARTSRYLLTGLLRCMHCGHAMNGQPRSRQQNGVRHEAYMCSGYALRRVCLSPNMIRCDRLDALVIEAVGEILRSGRTDLATVRVDDAAIRRDLAAAEAGLQSLDGVVDRAWQAYLAGRAPLERYEEAMQTVERDRTRLTAQLAELRESANSERHTADRLQQLVGSYEVVMVDGADRQAQKAWLQEHVNVIRVRGERSHPVAIEIDLA